MKIKCIIVEDEYPARMLMAEYIRKVPGLELVGEGENGLQALALLQEKEVDLMFLDIQMPDLSGLNLLKSLKKKPFVVLTTAYSEYALDAFELEVIDYLLKPIPFERFLQAVNRVAELMEKGSKPKEKDHFFVAADGKMVRINFHEILFIEGLKEYVRIHLPDRKVVTLASLKQLENDLPAGKFARIHRSWIVSLAKVDSFWGTGVEISGRQIPVGKSYREGLKERFLTE